MIKIDTLEDIKNELLVQASCMVIGYEIERPIIKKLFDSLLNYGIYSDAFLDILYPNVDYTMPELYLIFTQALQAISYPIPENLQQAREAIIQYHLKRIVDQKEDIYKEIGELYGRLHDNGDKIFGRAQKLCDEYKRMTSEYPFNVDHETDEERDDLARYLFKIAEHCLDP